MGGKEIEHVPPVFNDANTRANTIANLAKASRTEYRSNQIGQFSANKVRTRIGMGNRGGKREREREGEREREITHWQAAGRQTESKKEK